MTLEEVKSLQYGDFVAREDDSRVWMVALVKLRGVNQRVIAKTYEDMLDEPELWRPVSIQPKKYSWLRRLFS